MYLNSQLHLGVGHRLQGSKEATTHSTAHSVTMPGASRRRRLPAPLCLEKMVQVMEELGNGQIACVRSCLKRVCVSCSLKCLCQLHPQVLPGVQPTSFLPTEP